MTDEPNHATPLPDDPVEAELVAYLDGELDGEAERTVEARLASDPQLRARADALKKTFDLLDFLPRADPSPDFAARTVEKLPAVKSNPESRPGVAAAARSSSVPIALSTGSIPGGTAGRPWFWVAAVLVCGIALAGGYFASAALRSIGTSDEKVQPYVAAPASPASDDDPPPERAIELLPLYAGADNLEFVRELAADPELFGDQAEGHGGVPLAARVPWAADLPALTKAFKSLPPERQKQLRLLDQQLHQLPAAERTTLLRALEAYAVWMNHLAESERQPILAAANGRDRLDEVRETRRTQWVAALPAVQQKQIKVLPAAERAAYLMKWREEESERRKAWSLPGPTREAIRLGKSPYPFDNDELKRQVVEYARATYRLEDRERDKEKEPKRAKLSPNDLAWLTEAYELGRDEGMWLWFGKLLYDLSWRYEMLPEPDGRPPLTDYSHLWESARMHYTKNAARQRVQRHLGRWPEFALAAREDLMQSKVGTPPADFSFGPASPNEFRTPTRLFVERELVPILRPFERLQLKGFEGQWPVYPRLLMLLARKHDRSVPGAMLPGRPSDWDRTYGGSSGRSVLRPKG